MAEYCKNCKYIWLNITVLTAPKQWWSYVQKCVYILWLGYFTWHNVFRSIHAATYASMSFLLSHPMVCVYTCSHARMNHILFIHSTTNGHLSSLFCLASMNTEYRYCLLFIGARKTQLPLQMGKLRSLSEFSHTVTQLRSNGNQPRPHQALSEGELFAHPMTPSKDFRTEEPEVTRREQMAHKECPTWKLTPVW